MSFSALATEALQVASELSHPAPPGPHELLAAISGTSHEPQDEAQQLSALLRSIGIAAAVLKRLALAEPRDAGPLDGVLDRAESIRLAEGIPEITCPHLLLAVLEKPTPQLQKRFAEVSLDSDELFTRTLTVMPSPHPATRPRDRRMVESFVGQWIDGRYKVLDGAQGGMGCVLFCEDLETGQPVAVKMRAEAASPELFLEEARKWIELGAHPHIVQALYANCIAAANVSAEPVRRVVPSPDAPSAAQPARESLVYIVLEMVARSTQSGCSLRDWLRDIPRIPSAPLIRWAVQVAGALEFSSARQGLIHQDVKPDNVLITPSGDAKLTDFGVALHIGDAGGTVAGTPIYMAPEHRAGRPSVRSDVYSFGLTLAESLLGRLRSDYLVLVPDGQPGSLSEEQLALLMLTSRPEADPATPEMCRELARLVKTCTHPDPARRFDGFGQVRSALAALAKTHLNVTLQLDAGAAETSAADRTNRAVALLRLHGNAEADRAIRLLAQSLAQSPGNPIALDWLRRSCDAYLNSAQILRLAWFRLRLSLSHAAGWYRALGAIALLALLLFTSPAPAATKASALVLALVLGTEAYVNYLSGRTLKFFGIGVYIVCGALFLLGVRYLPQTPLPLPPLGHTILGFFLVAWMFLLLSIVRQSKWDRESGVAAWRTLAAILLALGEARAILLLILFPYASLGFHYWSLYQSRSYTKRLARQGVFLGPLQEFASPPISASAPLLLCVLAVMLWGGPVLARSASLEAALLGLVLMCGYVPLLFVRGMPETQGGTTP